MCSMKDNPSSCSHVELLALLQLCDQEQCYGGRLSECATSMFLYMLIFMAYHGSRWIPRNQRLKFQIVNAVFTALVLVPQFYVMGRPKSSRYCRQPLLNNLSASIAFSFVASGFSVIFTLIYPVPQSLWASYHVFGLLTCGHGLCTAILTLTAAACYRVFRCERRTVVDQQAACDRKQSSCPTLTSDTPHIKISCGFHATNRS
ncbi:probable intracellular septation protein A isoform X2 [Micropterus salmoides]|uniref:probable intracellular septation protein A isoform X2 n=1 Tax=Micropterus salmoides TaxID=27706 RepID=UPI0018EC889B|nr:probable intracellular septation protein A isoform X2 [Micropterus salmoides]